jgi:hypothetical protein
MLVARSSPRDPWPPVFRLLSCLLAAAVLCVVLASSPTQLPEVDRVAARASLPTCPTAKRPKAEFARCYVDRSKRGANNKFFGTGAKEYFDGRGGVDRIVAQGGNDTIIGGPGQDRIAAGGGRNTIDVRDGEKDRVVCGPGGRDVIFADAIDDLGPTCKDVRR